MRFDTLNMYHKENFIGSEEFTYHNNAQLSYPNDVKSIILTGLDIL